MARVKKAVNAKKKHKKILKLSKGFYGQKSKVFRAANPAVMRSLASAYVGRKRKKRDYMKSLDRKDQRCCKTERNLLQPVHERS